MTINKLASNAKKALGVKASPKKSKPVNKVPVDVPSAYPEKRQVGGLPSDRYYAAKDAMHTMTRAEEIRGNKQLQSDIKKVAQHEIKGLQAVIGKDR